MRRLLALAMLLHAGSAPAESHGGYIGLGLGPTPKVGGELGEIYDGNRGETGGRIRFGARGDHVGLELVTNINALRGRDGEATASVSWGPAIVGYAIARPPVQLAGRLGIGGGKLGDAWGFGLDAGATLHVHALPGGGPMLWVDAGVQLVRHHLGERWIDGRIAQLTIGIAWAFEKSQ